MKISNLLKKDFYKINSKKYREMISIDYEFNRSFRGGSLSKKFLNSYEWKYIKLYRQYQCSVGTIWEGYYKYKIDKMENKTGFSFEYNPSIGEGLIIGHWGKIVINGEVKFGSQIFLTHNVTIGRDIRGKHAGVPKLGDRVCIRANSTIVGGINIGNDVLIAPNTFVNFDVPDHSIVIGNPATIHYRENATEGHIPSLR